MNDVEKDAISRLLGLISTMSPYEKWRLIGIGEGMALAGIKAQPGDKDTQRAMLGMTPKESA